MINPYTGQDDGMQAPGMLPGAAGAPPAAMPPPMSPPGLGDAPMAPGTSGGAPPELQQAMQVLQQADQVMGPGTGGAPSGAPPPGMMPPSGAPPLPSASGPPSAQLPGIRQQQIAGMGQARGLEQQQAGVDDQAAGVRSGRAEVAADVDAQRVSLEHQKQDEIQRAQNFQAQRQASAKQASDSAANAWAQFKPHEWFEKKERNAPLGNQMVVWLGIALANIADEMNRGQGRQSNLGQQALALINQKMEAEKTQEMTALERTMKVTAANEHQVGMERAAAIAKIEDKYAGIEKGLELAAKAKLSAIGMDAAAIENNQVVVDRKKRALEAEQKRIDAINTFVDREIATSMRKRAGAKGGPADPNDPYAGLTANQRDIARRKDEALEIPNLDGTLAGKARTPDEGKKLRQAQEATTTFVDNLQRLKEFIGREGTFQAPGFEEGARDEKKGLVTALAGAMTVKNHTGVLSAGEYERYRQVVSSGLTTKNARAAENIDKLIAEAQESYARAVRAQVSGKAAAGTNPGEAPPTSPAALPAARPKGTSKFTPDDIEAMRWLQANPDNPMAMQIRDGLRRKYGAASGL